MAKSEDNCSSQNQVFRKFCLGYAEEDQQPGRRMAICTLWRKKLIWVSFISFLGLMEEIKLTVFLIGRKEIAFGC
jgi:hypothetical protein